MPFPPSPSDGTNLLKWENLWILDSQDLVIFLKKKICHICFTVWNKTKQDHGSIKSHMVWIALRMKSFVHFVKSN